MSFIVLLLVAVLVSPASKLDERSAARRKPNQPCNLYANWPKPVSASIGKSFILPFGELVIIIRMFYICTNDKRPCNPKNNKKIGTRSSM